MHKMTCRDHDDSSSQPRWMSHQSLLSHWCSTVYSSSISLFENSVDPDQLVSSEASWSGSTLIFMMKSKDKSMALLKWLFCLFDLILYVPVNNQLCLVGPSWVEPVICKDLCLAQGHNTMRWGSNPQALYNWANALRWNGCKTVFTHSDHFSCLLLTFENTKQFGPRSGPEIRTKIMSVLIWIQTVWHSDSVLERIFHKS